MASRRQRQILTGWSRTSPSAATVVRPASEAEVTQALVAPETRGVLPRGLGRSYGDAAQNAGGTVLQTDGLLGPLEVDEAGLAVVGAGRSLEELMRHLLPRGWFVPVTPGTRQVTIGGAFASDIHGKNHHVDGSFSRHVTQLRLVTPVGPLDLKPDDELFGATAGGMGLTGVISELRLQLMPVETSLMTVDTCRTRDLDETMAAMSADDERYRYSVAWIDCQTGGRHLGRSVLTSGDHAPREALPDKHPRGALTFSPRAPLPSPPWVPSGLINSASIRVFNELWYRRFPKRETGALQTIGQFFHPLDGVANWNRLYGRRGFAQYQMVVPLGEEEALRQTVIKLVEARAPSFLGVLKRFGPGGAGHLSFPLAGWTLAVDLPIGGADLAGLLDHLDQRVAAAGGRVYLAKDSRLRPELVPVMYPRLEEWRRVRHQVDPQGILVSDLARRLRLLG